MIKKIKYLTMLFAFIILITGCTASWTDVYEEYSDKIGSGINCNYVASPDGNTGNKIKYLKLSIEKKGITVKIAKEDKLFDASINIVSEEMPDDYAQTFEYGDMTYDIQSLKLDSFIDYYYTNKQCPPLYFLRASTLFSYVDEYKEDNKSSYAIFTPAVEEEGDLEEPELPSIDNTMGGNFSCYYSEREGSHSQNTVKHIRLDAFEDSYKIYLIKDDTMECKIDSYSLLMDSSKADYFYDQIGKFKFYIPKEDFSYNEFKNYYYANNNCQSLYFLSVSTLFHISNKSEYEDFEAPDKFVIFDETLKCDDPESLTDRCVTEEATSCRTYNKSDINSNNIYIQIGELDNGKLYLAISNNQSFDDYQMSTSLAGTNGIGLLVTYKDNIYAIVSNNVFEASGYAKDIYMCYNNDNQRYEIITDSDECSKGSIAMRSPYDTNPLTGAVTCSTLFGPEKGTIRTMISNILKFIKYGGPILMLLLTIVDLVKTATSGEEGDFKKVFQNFLKRFIAAALLFFIDLIIQLLFMIVGLESTCFFD